MILSPAYVMVRAGVVEKTIDDALTRFRIRERRLERALERGPCGEIETSRDSELHVAKCRFSRTVRDGAVEPTNGLLLAVLKRLQPALRLLAEALERLRGRALPFHAIPPSVSPVVR